MKTLEIRVSVRPIRIEIAALADETASIYYKKRCKRCKQKFLYGQDWPDGHVYPLALQDWETGVKVNLSSDETRPRLLVSEFTRRISRAAENTIGYLDRIRQVQTGEAR